MNDKIRYQIFLYNYYHFYRDNYYFDENYKQYFAKHMKNYIFLQNEKKSLKKAYYEKIEKIFQIVYHPKIVTNLLKNGMQIDNIYNLLNEKINNSMQNVF